MKNTYDTPASFGDFKILLRADGKVVIPDLAANLIPALQRIGANHQLWERSDCVVVNPKLKRNRHRLPELVEKVKQYIQPCCLCERQCRVNRLSGEVGFCRLDQHLRLFAGSNLYNEGHSSAIQPLEYFYRDVRYAVEPATARKTGISSKERYLLHSVLR